MADLSDICTLVWPVLRDADGKLPPSADAGTWILGWNPVGLSVVATALLSDMSFEEAQERLAATKSRLAGCRTPAGVPTYHSLQLLGYVCGSSANAVGSVDSSAANGAFPAASPTSELAATRSASPMRGPSAAADAMMGNSVRAMRKSDIWLELQEGPVLGEVWCCGYRVQPCQLHVIRCDPLRHHAVKPSVFSAVSLFGPGGVRQLKSGKRPIHVAGAESNLEGVLLPDVMVRESAPRVARVGAAGKGRASTGRGASEGATQLPPAPAGPLMHSSSMFVPGSSVIGRRKGRHSHRLMDTSLEGSASRLLLPDGVGAAESPLGSDSESAVTSFSFAIGAGGPAMMESFSEMNTYGDSLSQYPGYEEGGGWHKSPTLAARPGVPPRLDFPTSVDEAEMSTLLRMSSYGLNVPRVLRGDEPRCTTAAERPRHAGSAPGMSPEAQDSRVRRGGAQAADTSAGRPHVHFVLNALIEVNLLLIRIVSQLRRVSWLMEIVEHRLRELVNVLALLDGRTQSCGLHPALPHRTHCTKEGRRVCYIHYVARVLTDVLCGSVIMLLLRTQGPRMYTLAMSMSRYFLYEMHMSYMDWFDGWPAGLKVNEDLNQALCFLAKVTIRSWDLCMRRLFFVGHHLNASAVSILSRQGDDAEVLHTNSDHDVFGSTEYFWIVPSYDVLVPLSFLGASCSFALVADLAGLVTLHLRILYHAMSLPYRFARAVMTSLSNQFRGLKYNPLRKRTDVYEFTVDQMLMATFIFTIVVFLFPTVAVYYFYFALIRTSVWVVEESLLTLAHAMLYLPIFPFLLFSAFPKTLSRNFSGGVELSEPIVTMQRAHSSANGAASNAGNHRTSSSTTVELTVQGKAFSPGCFFSDFLLVTSVLATPFVPTRVVSLIFSGRSAHPTSPRGDLIPHLIANCVDPPCTLCVPANLPPSVLSSATTAAAISVSFPAAPHTPSHGN